MADSRVARSGRGAASYSGNASGLAVDSDTDQLFLNIDGTQRPMATSAFRTITTSETALATQSGTTFSCNSTTSIVITLPSTIAGLRYTMFVKGLTTSGGHAFSPAAADKIIYGATTAVDDKDLICTAATDRVGDAVTIVGDGIDGWIVTAAVGTWAAEA